MTFGWEKDGFAVSLARNADDISAVQRLRYTVFIEEFGGDGPQVDHTRQAEIDPFDAVSDHLMVHETTHGTLVGVYRLLMTAQSGDAFYTDAEFDLTCLRGSGRRLLELGRSCVRADYRGSAALFHLWGGLARYVDLHGAEILFGTASFKGTDIDAILPSLSLLHHKHRARPELRPRANPDIGMTLIPEANIDTRAAMIAMPPLVKAYLRLGARVGDGVFVDHAFQCTDVCMVMDTQALNQKYARFYQPEAAE